MNRIFFVLSFVFAATAAWASGGESGGTDFIPRVVNFLIFVAILWYFLADIIRNFFAGRSQAIADRLDEVQHRLKANKEAKETAKDELEAAKRKAAEIIESAKKECRLLAKKMDDQLHDELENMQKLQAEKEDVERRKMVRQTVKETMGELFADKQIGLDENKFVNLISKKAA